MVSKKSDSTQEVISENSQSNNNATSVPSEYFLEFITRHHLQSLWDEFVYEKNHPKIPLSATEVLALINLSPEEQEKILKEYD